MPKDTFFNLDDSKRKRIIDAAIQEFSDNKYSSVTIDGIVARAKIPKGSFYQYFYNKDDLFVYLFDRIGGDKKKVLDSMSDMADELPFSEFLIRVFYKGIEFESKDQRLQELKSRFTKECSQTVKNEILMNELPKSYKFFKDILNTYIVKGEISSSINKPLVAYMLTSCITDLENFLALEKTEDFYTSAEEPIKAIFDIIMNGIKKI